MAETSLCSGMDESEIAVLKDALRTQQQLLQKLYFELDEERESSATAATETLSMILRLQGEKAAEKMEASQYKRMAEERMHHVEQTLLDFEEFMYQKEMEISSLGFQVQAYRCKLLSMGFGDLSIGETRYPENFLEQQNEAHFGDIGVSGTLRRNNSLPPIRFKDSYYKNGMIEREGSAMTLMKIDEDMVCEFNVQNANLHKKCKEPSTGHFDSYWEQIKELDERVKQLSHSKDVDVRVESDCILPNQGLQSTSRESSSMKLKDEPKANYSLHSQVSRNPLDNPTGRAIGTDVDSVWKYSHSNPKAECIGNLDASRNTTNPTNVYDVFEVPQIHENYKFCEPHEQEHNTLMVESQNSLGKPDSVNPVTLDYYVKDETDWIKKMLQYAPCEKGFSKSRDGVTVDCHLALMGPKVCDAPYQPEIQQLNNRLEMLEDERRIIIKEAAVSREEGLKLLREIHEQLRTIKSDIRNLKYMQSPLADETSLLIFQEAMLSFWL